MPPFVHLHTHSHYSLLDGLSKIPEMVALAKSYKMPALAITDHGALYGAIQFYRECKKAGIKPIIGVEAYIAHRSRHDREPGVDNKRYHLTLLAKNNTGYQNLLKLITLSHLEGYYYKPRIDKELLRKYNDGLVCLSGCFSSELSRALRNKNTEEAERVIREHHDIFGAENYFLEIMHHPAVERLDEVRTATIALGKKFNIPLVGTQDSHYLYKEDARAHDTLIAIQTNTDIKDEKRLIFAGHDFHFIDSDAAWNNFKDTPEAVLNTLKIADRCEMELEPGNWVFPNFKVGKDTTHDKELERLTHEGLAFRNLPHTEENVARIAYELDIIKTKQFSPYFLVVADILRFARKNNILTNTRGSAAGSFVSYLLGITNINPIEYKLPFERFLNPHRPSAPDIDMDFEDTRRGEVIQYAKKKYGDEHVAQIGTYGTMMARGSVRDVARSLGKPYITGDRIARLIPFGSQGFPMTIDRALETTPELREMYEKEDEVREILDLAKRLEGCARHISVHAAGVVIAPQPLMEIVPLQYDPHEQSVITQYDMHAVEYVGLLKLDFLGIKNLTILNNSVKLAKKFHGVDIDIERIPLDDAKTFETLARGETMGLFQLNGSGMTQYLKELEPTSIHDINAMVALYRPGPMAFIPEYIRRKKNPKLITYLDKRMENILDQSYGIITYQDDILAIAIKIAGYSWGEVDKLRKAVGKKIPREMQAQKEKFINGCIANDMPSERVQTLWEMIETFAAYGFNKCLTIDTRVVNAHTGLPEKIGDLLFRKTSCTVHALNSNFKLIQKNATGPFKNGVKPVFCLTTRSGRSIRATGNHPFLTWEGWVPLDQLKSGERIAAPRRIPEPRGAGPLPFHEATALGYLLSEGNLCHPHGVYFYSSANEEISDFIRSVQKFINTRITIDRSKSAISVYVGQASRQISGQEQTGNTLLVWLRKLGLAGKRATEKFVPEIVFSADNASVAVFLGKLWQGDGCVSIQNQLLYYATSSHQLARDVQHLLLRLGIISTVYAKQFRYRDGRKPGWTVSVHGAENFDAFLHTAGKYLVGAKKKDAETVLQNARKRTNNRGRGTSDPVPVDVIELVRSKMAAAGTTSRELGEAASVSLRVLGRDARKRGYTRPLLARVAHALESEILLSHAESDIFWDEVVSIQPDGKEMTYDISVPGTENFVANDLIVHNSHAASYGRVAYQTSYMKAHYPTEYMAAILNADAGDVEKIAEAIIECTRLNISVLPPDVNESFGDFTIIKNESGDKIRFGLYSIKNFGNEIANAIIAEREAHGKFKSFADFLERIQHKNLNKKSLESLIKCGAMDGLGNREQMLGNLEESLAYNREQEKGVYKQDSLFNLMENQASVPQLRLKEVSPVSVKEKLSWEKELLGLYVSGHPLETHREKFKQLDIDIRKVKRLREGVAVTVGGMIEEIKTILTSQGEKMAFLKISDLYDSIETVIFPRAFNEYKNILVSDRTILARGKISHRKGAPSIILEKVKEL